MKAIILTVLGIAVAVAYAEKQPYERYQSIVERQMFGPLPPGFDPTKMPSEVSKSEQKELTQEQEKLQSAIHFSMINVTPDGYTAVGFTDNSDPKAPVNYYLKVGEQRNGWEVKEADPAAATMKIAKGDIEVSLSLGGNSAKDAASTAKGESLKRSGLRGGLLGGSLRARRMQRQQEERAQSEAEAAAKEAERQAKEEADKAQREAERAEQRQQLLAIQEELKRVREAKATQTQNKEEVSESED